jgi:Flp pilus assembly pilin Flp
VIRYAIELIRSLVKDERGQDLIEYAMLGGLIALALAAVATLGILTGAVSAMAEGIGNCIDFNSGTTCAPF